MTDINERPHPGDLLTLAFELINARGAEYDNASSIEQNFREAAAVASVVIGKALTAARRRDGPGLRQADPVQKRARTSSTTTLTA